MKPGGMDENEKIRKLAYWLKGLCEKRTHGEVVLKMVDGKINEHPKIIHSIDIGDL